MRIATYNVNGINSRLAVLLEWLGQTSPDIVCLQELKAVDEKFPEAELEEAGYGAVWKGEARWNGVAILAKGVEPILTRSALPASAHDPQSRYIEAAIKGVIIACLYVPNGNPRPGPRFDYKLEWLKRFLAHTQDLQSAGLPVILAGDFNIIPTDADVYEPDRWRDDALFARPVREAFDVLQKQGWSDALRTIYPTETVYTFWKYLRQAYGRNAGLRIDHIMLSKSLVPRLIGAGVDRSVRALPKSSDHAPVWIELADPPGKKRRQI